MTAQQGLFIVFGVITVLTALGVVLARNLFHAALWLATTFLGVACVYILLNADFVGMSQIIVYVGAVSILMLFAIMLTEDVVGAKRKSLRNAWPASLPVVVALCMILFKWFVGYSWPEPATLLETETVGKIGLAFLQKYLFAFELASVILLAALIGAILLAREEKS